MRPLPGSSLLVSRLGLGTVKFGRNEQVKYPEPFDLPTDPEILHLLETARECGINLLDTAPAYGSSEERLGKLLGTRRDDWVISTKAGEDFEGGRSSFDFRGTAIRNSVERSLQRLRTDRVEIVMLHSDGNDVGILQDTDAVATLCELRDEGKVCNVGISTKTVEGGCLAFEMGLDLVMATYNAWHTEELPVLDAAMAAGKAVLIKKAFSSGWFGDVPGMPTTLPQAMDPVEHSLRTVFAHPASLAVIVGTLRESHLRANAAVVAKVLTTG